MFFLFVGTLSALAAADPGALRGAVRTGDCPGVLRLVGGESAAGPTDAERLVAARCVGRERALEWLAPVAADGVLAEPARRLRVRFLLHTPDPGMLPDEPAARAILEALPAAPVATDLELRLARDKALVALGLGLEARDDLRALLETDLAPEARYWLAWAAERRGDTGPAAATWLALWIRDAASPWSGRAAERLAALGQPVPALGTPEGRAQALQRVAALREARRPAEALALLRDVEAAAGTVDARLRAETCFEGRDYACAVEAFQRLGSPAAVGPETLFDHAVATYRAGDPEGARQLYTALYQRHPDHPRGDEASYKIGYAAVDQGRWEEAIAALEAHLTRFPSSTHADEARWYVGWCRHKLGQPQQAVSAWARMQQAHPSSSLVPAAAYWSAADGPAEARDGALARVAQRWPESGQAWFALQRLGRQVRIPAAPAPALPALPAAFSAAQPRVATAESLLSVGLDDLAMIELEALAATAGQADRATRLALALRLADLGDVAAARRLASPTCAGADAQARALCLPRPHLDVVAAALAGSDLDPYLPYAIMTAESGMDPSVTSPAGARGLMQLMPAVAERLFAAAHPGAPFDPDRLYLGAFNAALGTAELRRLHEHYLALGHEETLPMVIAAYNGGQEAVDRWLAAAGPAPALDAWAEDIAFAETRRYVRRVLGVLRAYHRGYGG